MCSLLKRKISELLDLRVRVLETTPDVSNMSSKADVCSTRGTVLLYLSLWYIGWCYNGTEL